MRYNKYKDANSLKTELENGEIEPVVDFLKTINIALTDSLRAKIDGIHTRFETLKHDNMSGILTLEEFNAKMNLIRRDTIVFIGRLFSSFTPAEFEKAINFSSFFEEGAELYRKKKWKESLDALKIAQLHYIPKFEKAAFDLNTKLTLVNAQISLDEHKTFFCNTDEALETTSRLTIETFLKSSTFKNHSFKNQIILDRSTLEFTPIIKGTYKNTKINRTATEIKIPKSKNISEIIDEGINADLLNQQILPEATSKIDKAFSYMEFEDMAPLSIRGIENITYQVTETEESKCKSCSYGLLKCNECINGIQDCEVCKGGFTDCTECFRGKISCPNCEGEEMKTCPDCNGGEENCDTCGAGEIRAHCMLCDNNTREIDCPECEPGGKIKCDKCYFGKIKCETCINGNVECETCRGVGYMYTVSFIKTENVTCEEPFLYELNRADNSIQQLKLGVAQQLKSSEGYKSSGLEVFTFFRTDGYKVDFEVEDQQQAIRKEHRKSQGISQDEKYPLLTEETIKYEILPCFKIKYSSVYNKKEKYHLYLPMRDKEEFELVFEKTPNIEKLPSKGKFKIGLGRAFSSKKQLSVDDTYKEVNLLIHLANQDHEFDLLEKEGLSNLLFDTVPHFSKDAQSALFDRVKNETPISLTATNYRFSKQEAGLKALDNINQIVQKEVFPKKIENEIANIKTNIVKASPSRVTYVRNFFREPNIFIPMFLLLLAIIAGVIYFFELV